MPALSFGAPFPQNGGFYASQSSSSQTLPIEPVLPEWMGTDPNAFTGEMSDMYGSIGNFGANKAARAIDRRSAINQTMGMQAANNAAQDYTSRLMQGGATAFASGAVKAQAMMPVLKQSADTEVSKQAMLMDARKAAASMKSQLSGQMAGARQSYLSNLAGMYTTMRGQNIQYDANSNAYGQGGAGAGTANPFGVGANAAPFTPGYIPNQGPIIPSAGWYGANGSNVLTDPSIGFRNSWSPGTGQVARAGRR
jgi:hypothetical protein